MKLAVPLDYDGTIARGDVLDPDVRAAIADALTNGIVTLLVTARILGERQGAAGRLHFVDGVVAENGAVLYLAGRRIPVHARPAGFRGIRGGVEAPRHSAYRRAVSGRR